MGRVDEGQAPDDALRVLIAEDNEHLCELFRAWLTDEFDVDLALDGDEALAVFDAQVDIMILDRRMPAMTGDEVLETVRSRGWDGQVIMVTAAEPTADVIRLEVDDYLMKPVDRSELLDAVDTQRRVRQLEPPLQEYFSLAAKRRAIDAVPGTVASIRESGRDASAYEDLLERIEALERTLDPQLLGLGGSDIRASDTGETGSDEGPAITQ